MNKYSNVQICHSDLKLEFVCSLIYLHISNISFPQRQHNPEKLIHLAP